MRILIRPSAFTLLISLTIVSSEFKITFLPLMDQKYRYKKIINTVFQVHMGWEK